MELKKDVREKFKKKKGHGDNALRLIVHPVLYSNAQEASEARGRSAMISGGSRKKELLSSGSTTTMVASPTSHGRLKGGRLHG
jgi:hypothetical protein